MERIILLLDLTQPLHVLTIHLLQGRPIYCIIGVRRCHRQVLTVLDPSFENGSTQSPHAVVYILVLVERLVVPPDKEARWEDGTGTVRRVRGWPTMCEDVGLEWVEVEGDRNILVLLEEFVPQGLRHELQVSDIERNCSGTP